MSNNANTTQAAILLKSLSKTHAAGIMSRLDSDELKSVLEQVNDLDQLTAGQIADASAAFRRQLENSRPGDIAINASTGQNILVDIAKSELFDFVVELLPEARFDLLCDEHPRNIAILLAAIAPDTASETLRLLEPATRVSVLRRLCQVDGFDIDEAKKLAVTLERRLKKKLADSKATQSGIERAASLLSCATEDEQHSLLAFISQTDPDLARHLGQLVFSFCDLKRLSDRDIKTILSHCDISLWAPSLKHADHQTRVKVIKNMATRPADLLSQEIAELVVVDKYVAHHAQSQIIRLVLKLVEEGKIALPIVE